MEEALNIIDFWSFYDENYESTFIDEWRARIAVEKAFYNGQSSVKFKPLKWTEVFYSEEYNYIVANTSIGECKIVWKQSPEYSEEFNSYLVEFHILDETIYTTLMCPTFNIDNLINLAQDLFESKVKNCLILK